VNLSREECNLSLLNARFISFSLIFLSHFHHQNGRFGSTQSTILALKAIIAYDLYKMKPEPGSVSVYLNGEEVSTVTFDPSKSTSLIELPSFAESIKAGEEHELKIQMKGGMDLPYSCAVEFNAVKMREKKFYFSYFLAAKTRYT